MSPSPTDPSPTPTTTCAAIQPVELLLAGPPSAGYAGIYAADAERIFDAACLAVSVMHDRAPGALTSDPPQVGVWTAIEGLAARERGADVVDVAQVHQRSGLRQVSWADRPVFEPGDFRTRRIGTPDDHLEVLAASAGAGIDPAYDVAFLSPGDHRSLLADKVDAAAVQTYDGYARLLGGTHPRTGTRITPADLVTIDYEALGWGLLPDGLWADGAALADPAYRDVVQRLVTASLEGWILCRDEAPTCAQALQARLPGTAPDERARMVEQATALAWPSVGGIGTVDPAAWDRTVAIALATVRLDGERFITSPPGDGAYTNELALAAAEALRSRGLAP